MHMFLYMSKPRVNSQNLNNLATRSDHLSLKFKLYIT